MTAILSAWEVGIITSALEMRTPRSREVKEYAAEMDSQSDSETLL